MRKRSYSTIMIMVMGGLLIVLIVFAALVASDAFFSRGQVVLGDRFKNDLDHHISSTQLDEVSKNISSLDKVKSVEVNNASALVRVLVEVNADTSVEDATKLVKGAYEATVKLLPVEKYFKAHDAVRNYDLEINVYARNKSGDGNALLINGVKNSSMNELVTKVVLPYDSKKDGKKE